jgi:uncharacterized membrane protein YdjX (TVP38/TMEM64 family)
MQDNSSGPGCHDASASPLLLPVGHRQHELGVGSLPSPEFTACVRSSIVVDEHSTHDATRAPESRVFRLEDTEQPLAARRLVVEAGPAVGVASPATRPHGLVPSEPRDLESERNVLSPAERQKRICYTILAMLVAAFSIAVGARFGNQIFNAIIDAKDFLRDEPLSLIGYYAFFTVMAMLFMPYSPFCIAIGFIFGIYWGFVIEMINIFLSSSMIFLVGRYLFKDYIEQKILQPESSTANVWKGLLKYMGRDWKEAAKINLLLCFIPMPYGMNRYLVSLTNVPFGPYNLFFMVGMIPNTGLNLLIGAALAEASEEDGVNVYRLIGTGVAILGIMLAIWYAKIVAEKVLVESRQQEASEKHAQQAANEGAHGEEEDIITVCVSGEGALDNAEDEAMSTASAEHREELGGHVGARETGGSALRLVPMEKEESLALVQQHRRSYSWPSLPAGFRQSICAPLSPSDYGVLPTQSWVPGSEEKDTALVQPSREGLGFGV